MGPGWACAEGCRSGAHRPARAADQCHPAAADRGLAAAAAAPAGGGLRGPGIGTGAADLRGRPAGARPRRRAGPYRPCDAAGARFAVAAGSGRPRAASRAGTAAAAAGAGAIGAASPAARARRAGAHRCADGHRQCARLRRGAAPRVQACPASARAAGPGRAGSGPVQAVQSGPWHGCWRCGLAARRVPAQRAFQARHGCGRAAGRRGVRRAAAGFRHGRGPGRAGVVARRVARAAPARRHDRDAADDQCRPGGGEPGPSLSECPGADAGGRRGALHRQACRP
mmetsp:Transcript_78082/g.216635  ORF Transcript_78082/g.216635 Transcript_78082/m.216635 type:complete len:283 (-) Transcript_78082:2220-3068(-)